jgi:hypothetical protein
MSGIFGGGESKSAERAARAQIQEQRMENTRLRQQAEEERRELAERAESSRRARLRGGSRMLLSEARVAPEEGIGMLGTADYERN